MCTLKGYLLYFYTAGFFLPAAALLLTRFLSVNTKTLINCNILFQQMCTEDLHSYFNICDS